MGICWATRVKAESPSFDNSRAKRSPPSGDSTKRTQDIFSSVSNIEFTLALNHKVSDSDRHSSSFNVRPFSFNDLKAATKNFHHEYLLGEGGFGCVYKGWLDDQGFTPTKAGTGMRIAVKKLNLEGLQGHKEWLAEVHYLGQLHHPNLVKLIGFCAEDDHRLLVYEFMQRGSLENHLFRRSPNHPLSWALRIKIALGAAKGLAFLHDAERQVIYRDFKTSNILLDSQYNAKLSDFGLAKDGPTGDNTHVSTRVMGTYGYAAPEYVATGHLTAKSDVYSFGVVLLEMLTGRRAVDKTRPGMEQNLVEWAKPILHDKRSFYRLIDSRLQGQFFTKEAHKIACLALYCLNSDAKMRPHMKEVVEILQPVVARYSQDPQLPSRQHSSRISKYPQNMKIFAPPKNGDTQLGCVVFQSPGSQESPRVQGGYMEGR